MWIRSDNKIIQNVSIHAPTTKTNKKAHQNKTTRNILIEQQRAEPKHANDEYNHVHYKIILRHVIHG